MKKFLLAVVCVYVASFLLLAFVEPMEKEIDSMFLGFAYVSPVLFAITVAGFLGFHQNPVAVYGCAGAASALLYPEVSLPILSSLWALIGI